nr:GNAT family N-acetyltransferase [Planosporangium thailandense]
MKALLRAANLAVAADVPEDPPWRPDSFREYLSVTMPDERRVSWLALDGDDLLGYVSILLVGDVAVLELLVRPDVRRTGVGTALLGAAATRARAEGYGSIGVEVIGDTPAGDFFEAQGFRCAFVEMRNLLDLSTVDWTQLATMAESVGSGYRLEYHPGGPAESILDEYAKAKATMRLNPAYDLELRPSSYDSERLRASLATLHARGLKPYVVLAVHEPSGTVAGLTEVVVPAQRPTRADQYDTVVVQAHRGYGLGRALKARMLSELRAAEPQLLDVQTWNAVGAKAVTRINDELGFRPNREWREYEADVDEVLRRLGAPADQAP